MTTVEAYAGTPRIGGHPVTGVRAPAPEDFAEEVLQIITKATWPDGSALVDVADEVLRRSLGPQLVAAAQVLAASSVLSAHASFGGQR